MVAAMLPAPVPLGLPGLVLWYDPSQETAWADTQEVTTMTDFSGNGWDATVEPTRTGPTYEVANRNGLATFGCALGVAMVTIGLNLQDGDYTIYCVVDYSSPEAANQERLMHSSTGSLLIVGLDLTVGVNERVFAASTAGTTSGSVAVGGTWQVNSWRFARVGDPNRVEIRRALDGSGPTIVLGGSSIVAYPAGGADVVRPTWFSQINGGADYLIGSVGDVLLYNQAHSLADLQALYAYLYDKWAIT